MGDKESFHRGDELGVESRKLPAKTYNTMRLLLDYSESTCVFVPIRSMQYLAIIDNEETIFVDGLSVRRMVEFTWRQFKSHKRTNLTDPVEYQLCYYDEKALETMKRLQWEFDKALHVYYDRFKDDQPNTEADVIPLNQPDE